MPGCSSLARVAELVDAADLKSAFRKEVRVRVSSWAPYKTGTCYFPGVVPFQRCEDYRFGQIPEGSQVVFDLTQVASESQTKKLARRLSGIGFVRAMFRSVEGTNAQCEARDGHQAAVNAVPGFVQKFLARRRKKVFNVHTRKSERRPHWMHSSLLIRSAR